MTYESKTHRVLRLILFLSTNSHKTREECLSFLGIRETAFYSYCKLIKDIGFDLNQEEGLYWIEYSDQDFKVLKTTLGFTEEELYLLARTIDLLDEAPARTSRLKSKLLALLNQEQIIENYIREKSSKVQALNKALKNKKQILLVKYSSGNSGKVRDRLVEPFEFNDDFNMIWAFDTELKQNRQFKVCRIHDVGESNIGWEHERSHQSMPVDIFHNTGKLNKTIELTLNLKARNLLIEEYPLSERYLVQVDSDSYELKTCVARYEGPARFAIGLAEDIEIRGDKGFLDFIDQKLKNIFRLRETRSGSVEI